MDDELGRLRWMTVDELAAARRSVIRRLNRLDRSQPDVDMREAVLQRVMQQIGEVQDGRRRDR
ncbi:hypothetical protein [Curtobacterium flaccumfaciens]|uniref:hypothetical protein n=1 Tax=Curtobacterium flaccumfaciens TaxID=2035 RepID=UPI001BE0576E|nr:hypothetical protein [Curtobacterium flaccumfaciens]MBT1658556.1 hypothetical protein [Curtobacterium flaccumfaciens pv. betae]MCS0472886.1 hypothetical protein [Curtobacterium flaccumfaciens pv. betae]MCS0476309.1 hypothetical protein [Curtobacterium flaccumfaciens pv. betae]MCS0479735.1 hypothetical protein [Curtobacterium flaccumfaciens pv. betae]MCS0483160.1 hypothetical protein [Curtobacterium flaccumfaciens pv. betae]